MNRKYVDSIAIPAASLQYGKSPRTVKCGFDVCIGAGDILPEVNFTLPPMLIRPETIEDVRARFKDIATRILQRATQLEQPAVVLEFEQLFELTVNPEWGASITADLKAVMAEFHQKEGLRSALRVTVADIRDQERPPRMRSGEPFRTMERAFGLCAAAGADILSIESTGGKEVSDKALLEGDLDGLVFALGVLAPRDMESLWAMIVSVAGRHGVLPGGDTACGFGNTAMHLAGQNMLPNVLAAVIRLLTIPRSLVAVEMGAVGPLKDCGYENPFIKSLTGVPISMEGKTSACAHSSPLGNIAASVGDMWSNESVQDVRLLGGFAPEVSCEMLTYDCRLMNTAATAGHGETMRDLLVQSDLKNNPQAYMFELSVIQKAAERLASAGPNDYRRAVAMTQVALETIEAAVASSRLSLSTREARWLKQLQRSFEDLPETETELGQRIAGGYEELFLPEEYGLPAVSVSGTR